MIIKWSLIILSCLNSITVFGNGLNPKDNLWVSADTVAYLQAMDKIENLKTAMLTYLNIAGPSYTEADVDECVAILNDFVIEIAKTNSRKAGMKVVELTVMKLNKLNEKCKGQLIETSEREQIAAIIISEGNAMGYNPEEEDITEAWREW